jgi:preprotein translocase subunit SecA
MEEGQPIEHGMVSKSIENAQKKVEAHNFEIRKNLLEYDEVNNLQRKFVYNLRNEIIDSPNIKEYYCAKVVPDVVDNLMESYIPPYSYQNEWDITGLRKQLKRFSTYTPVADLFEENQTEEGLRDELIDYFVKTHHQKEKEFKNYIKIAGVFGMEDEEAEFAEVVKRGILKTIDRNWMDTLAAMDHMKEGIGLRGYGQKDPLQEYKKEGFAIFSEMMDNINADAIEGLLKLSFGRAEESIYHSTQEKLDVDWDADFRAEEEKHGPQAAYNEERPVQKTVIREGKKVGRNDPCPCGSGKKYKKCCLAKETLVTS